MAKVVYWEGRLVQVVVMAVLWTLCIGTLLAGGDTRAVICDTLGYPFWLLTVVGPLLEEIEYRLLYVGFVLLVCGRPNWLVWLAAILLGGVGFGLVHGSVYNVLIQGVGGAALSWLYVMVAADYGARRPLGHVKALGVTWLAHGLINAVFYVIAVIICV